jgi:Tfp pilus assembly protein PilO
MNLTARDRKIVMILAPLLLVIVYWFVVLAPQRSESAKAEQELTKARGERDTAQAQIGQLNAAKASFSSDYQTVIRMGKAIPETVDMPSLLVQLDRAARGTGINMNDIKVSEVSETEAPAATTPPAGGTGPGAGGTGAQSMPGKAGQAAGNAVNQANGASAASAGAANAPAGGAAPAAPAPPGLATVGLQFKLVGGFFDMADFFHRMKRFVRVVNDSMVIRGRLISIDNWSFIVRADGRLDADVGATVYLSPKAQGGVSAGASPMGPAPAQPGGGTVAADPASQSPSPSAPTATASP